MSLPLNTNTMLFYGKAINDNTVVDYKSKFGFLDNYNVTNDLSTTYFKLGKRLTAEDKGKFHRSGAEREPYPYKGGLQDAGGRGTSGLSS